MIIGWNYNLIPPYYRIYTILIYNYYPIVYKIKLMKTGAFYIFKKNLDLL